MGNFKIEFPELKQFVKNLDNASKQDVFAKTEVANSILKVHRVIAERVDAVFNNPRSLENALVGHSVKFERLSSTFGRYGLQYRGKPIPLHEFPHSLMKSTSISSAPLRKANGMIKWTKGTWSHEVDVEVRRGRTQTTAKNGRRLYKAKGRIRVRKSDATWRRFPTYGDDGDREGMTSPTFGPSIPAMVKGVYNNDRAVAHAVDNCFDELSTTFMRYYFGTL